MYLTIVDKTNEIHIKYYIFIRHETKKAIFNILNALNLAFAYLSKDTRLVNYIQAFGLDLTKDVNIAFNVLWFLK